jgi:hypothetical protein
MPAYNRGEEKVEAYLVRILTALVRMNNGELRVPGHLIDEINEPTALFKEWDKSKQELVLKCGMHSFTEIFRCIPIRAEVRDTQTPVTVHDPLEKLIPTVPKTENFAPSTSTVDNPQLTELERKRAVARAAAIVRDELKRRKANQGNMSFD